MKFSISHTPCSVRATMRKRPAYLDSIAAAVAAVGIDIEELREAKREGCPAFRSRRVYRSAFRHNYRARARHALCCHLLTDRLPFCSR